jgi:hypothetical protein
LIDAQLELFAAYMLDEVVEVRIEHPNEQPLQHWGLVGRGTTQQDAHRSQLEPLAMIADNE